MSEYIRFEPVVKSPGTDRFRWGRGFSRREIEEAGLSVDEARRLGLMVDKRRKTVHAQNIDLLKKFLEEFESLTDLIMEETTADRAAAVAELASLRSVKKDEAELLYDAGIRSIEDLAYCDIGKTANKTGIAEERITAMVKAAFKKVS